LACGWCNNTLFLAQMVMVGATQLGYLRAWLRPKKPSCDLCRLHEAIAQWNRRPANFEQLRPSQRIVQVLAETLRWFPRVFHCTGM
jgi:hypothetical protein